MIDFNEYVSLVETLNEWAKAYSAGNSIVTDDVYDKKYIQLKEFEAANPAFILDNSPTRHVEDGAGRHDGRRKVAVHRHVEVDGAEAGADREVLGDAPGNRRAEREASDFRLRAVEG